MHPVHDQCISAHQVHEHWMGWSVGWEGAHWLVVGWLTGYGVALDLQKVS